MNNIAIIGVGNIGGKIAAANEPNFKIIKIDAADSLAQVENSQIIIIAVKPQDFPELSSQLRNHIKDQTIISVMAGIKLEKISRSLNSKNVVRTMPNLAIARKNSLTAAISSNAKSKKTTEKVINNWGKTIWLDEEQKFDIFTALAGSGPAYFYKLAAKLEKIALGAGFSKNQAKTIASQTLIGSASVLDNENTANELLKKVCSRGGVTEEAIKILDKNGFDQSIDKAVTAARQKSESLSK